MPPIQLDTFDASIHLECTDCIAGMQSLPPQSIDLIVTSPPYNLNIKYNTYKDQKTTEKFLQWCLQWANEIKRILHPQGSFFLNIGASAKHPLLPHQLVLAFTQEPDALFTLQNTLHWIKSISISTPQEPNINAGHFKPINSNRYLNDCHEYLFHFTHQGNILLDRKAAGVPYTHKSNIQRWKHTQGKDRRCRGNTWFIPYKTIKKRQKERPHPATFPKELAQRCIQLHGRDKINTMLDPFVGIGHSAQAAQEENIPQFIGFDIDPDYLSHCKQLLQTPKKA